MKIRNRRNFRPDSMVYLVVFVAVSMLVTTIAQAEKSSYSVSQAYSGNSLLIKRYPQRPAENGWLVPAGVRATLKGGMYHFQFTHEDQKPLTRWVPENTRFTLSIGNTNEDRVPGQYLEKQHGNTFLMSIDHRW